MTDSPARTDAAPGPPSTRQSGGGVVIAVLALCGTLVSLQQTMVLPLLPDLPDLIGTSPGNASWIVTATLLSGAVATPVISRMADMYGKRRMILVTLVIVAVGAAVGGVTTALPLLILARLLQGVGLALVPIGIATMRDELDPEQVPLAVALMSATLAIGAGAGLPLGGFLAEALDWHAVFWLPGVLAVLMILAVRTVVTESPVRSAGTFDVRGAILLSSALILLLLGISKGAEWGWTDQRTILSILVGVGLLVVLVPMELRRPNPLVDMRTAAKPAVLLANIISILMGFGMFANMLVSTQLLQTPSGTGYGIGLDALDAGLWMAPSAIAFGAMAPVSSWFTRRFGPETTIAIGAVIMTVSYAVRVPFSETLAQVAIGSVVVSVGTALAYSALPTLIMRSVPVTETAAANGLNTLLRSIGTSTASALVAAVFAASIVATGAQYPTFASMALIFLLASGVSALSVLLILPLMRRHADGTPPLSDELTQVDHVVHGRVEDPKGAAVPGAVVTALGEKGSHVDWAHTDSAGNFTVATAGPARHLFVVSAVGWSPLAVHTELSDQGRLPPFVLADQLTVYGTVHDSTGRPAGDISVVVTRRSGGSVDWMRSDADGHYSLPLPREGEYVITALQRETGALTTRLVAVSDGSVCLDLQLCPPARSEQVASAGTARD
ncbi:MFS transporter [Janibacter sp. GS2]|uniref:MFS transporter n=1 Tax=Janibacter sp. GS2 TaxID=3442646 RepID=UPI003EB8CBDF